MAVANVAEAGDIVLLGMVLVMTFVIGTALLALDRVVGRVHANREAKGLAARRDRTEGGGPTAGL